MTLLVTSTNRHILHNKVLIIMKLKITHNKLIIQPKCAFLSAILDLWILIQLGEGSIFVISDFVNSRVPNSTEIKLFLVFWSAIFGLAVHLAPGALLALPPPTVYKIYNKVAERLPKTTNTFIQICDSLINKV